MTGLKQDLLFVGIKNCVVALDPRDGTEVWRNKLKGSTFVSVLWDGEALFATSQGEVYRLEPSSGAVMWQNPLKGLGMGLVCLASTRGPVSSTAYETTAAQLQRQAAAAAAATT